MAAEAEVLKAPSPPQPEARSPESDSGRRVSPEQLIPGAEDQLLYNWREAERSEQVLCR